MFANLTARLNIDTKPFARGLLGASKQAKSFAKELTNMSGGTWDLAKGAEKSHFAFKDTARVIQGIMLSRVFYAGLQAVGSATNAVWEFSKSLEYAEIAYSNLFGDAELSAEFINVLKDFSAETPFAFEDSEKSARRLLAYGVEYKNVMFMMKGILAASSMTGDPQTVERVSRSLGQIYTKGRLMNEELRQLAEAGIPVYEILNDKLGLTKDQIATIGKQRIPADAAINALVTGMTDRFSGVVEGSTKTIQGRLSNIKDNLQIFMASAIKPWIEDLKVVFTGLEEFVKDVRSTMETQGLGGVFHKFIPKDLQPVISQLLGSLLTLLNIGKQLAQAFSVLTGAVFKALANVLNVIIPILMPIIGLFAQILSAVTENKTALTILSYTLLAAGLAFSWFASKMVLGFLLKPLIGVLVQAAGAFQLLGAAMLSNPIYAALGLLIAGFVALLLSIEKTRNALYSFFGLLTKIGGVDMDKMLLPSQKKRANDIEKFNHALSGTSKGMDDLAKNTGKAAKAAKMLLSFDEVFSLKTPDEGGAGIGDEIETPPIAVPDITPPDVGLPTLPSFGEYAKTYWENLKAALGEKFSDVAIGLGIGALLGGLLTGGSPLGMAIGALAGAVAGYFWDELKVAFGLKDGEAEVAGGIGAVIGGTVGGLVGGPVGIALGALAGAVVGLFWDAVHEEFNLSDDELFSLGIAGTIGGIAGYAAGGPIGAAIGMLAGAIVGVFWDDIALAFEEDHSLFDGAVGGAIGASIGTMAGGPIGGALGLLAGAIVGYFWEDIKLAFTENPSLFDGAVGGAIGASIGALAGGPIGAAIGLLVGSIVGYFTRDLAGGINTALTGLGTSIGIWWYDTGVWFQGIGATIQGWFSGAGTWLSEAGKNIIAGFSSAMKTAWTGVGEWFEGRKTAIGTALKNGVEYADWLYQTGRSIIYGLYGGFKNFWTSVGEWYEARKAAIKKALLGTEYPSQILFNIGKSIIKGLWNGMINFWATIAKWLSGLADWIKDHKGPISKDRKLLVDAGRAIFKGFGEGLRAEWSNVASQIRSYNTELASSFSGVDIGVSTPNVRGFASRSYATQATQSAAQPVVDAVSAGIATTLAPIVARIEDQSSRVPVYVGALIADERGLRELNRKMQVVNLQENRRRAE